MNTEPSMTSMNRLQMMKPLVVKLRLALIPWLLAAPAAGLAHERHPDTEIVVSSRAVLSSSEAAELRENLAHIIDIVYSIGSPRHNARMTRIATQGHEALARMTDDELALYAPSMQQIEELRRVLEEADALFGFARLDPDLMTRLDDDDDGPLMSVLPNAGYSTTCPSPRIDTFDARALLIALEVGRGIWVVLDRACTTVIAGFNGTVACIVADVILFGLETAYDLIAFCVADIDSAVARISVAAPDTVSRTL